MDNALEIEKKLALSRNNERCIGYAKEGFDKEAIVNRIFKKRNTFILNAKSIEELREIETETRLNPYNVTLNRFQIPEEELIFWSKESDIRHLNHLERQRMIYLYETIYNKKV